MLPLRKLTTLQHILRRGTFYGSCNICNQRTLFYKTGDWYREQLRCARCHSIARWRALISVLQQYAPDWQQSQLHEFSPGGAASDKLQKECTHYSASHYFPNVTPGSNHRGFRCENLEALTFADNSFDLVITQDVFEHLFNPQQAFAEVSRVLKPNGIHLFTIPWFGFEQSRQRAQLTDDQQVIHLLDAEYHGNPVDQKGSLVVTDWGQDLFQVIHSSSGMNTEQVECSNRRLGLVGEGLNVFISHAW